MKILLAIDTSSVSEIALEGVASRPWPAPSAFEVVCVVEPSPLWTTSEVAAESARRAQDAVRKAVGRLRAAGLDATGSALFGDARLQILDRAQVAGADFIFLGSHGHSNLTRFLLGNVAVTVLRHAPCSVGIVRPAHNEKDPGAAMRILLATDGSEYSGAAAQSIAERPWPAGSEVRIVSSVQLSLPLGHALFELPFVEDHVIQDAREEAMKRALDAVGEAGRILANTPLKVSDSVSVLFQNPREIVLQEASSWNADLIVLGSHGRNGPDRFLLGSVSEAVAMHAACSVEIIRAKAA
jgi:nucleotide-binding universal stress UspA family protein